MSMKRVSKKQAHINSQLHNVYHDIDTERPRVCEGCNRPEYFLHHSHLISQKRCKTLHKEHLIWDTRNIFIECLACHKRTESGNIEGMLNYQAKMDLLAEHDQQTLTRILTM